MSKREAINGKPYAGNPHVRFDEGEVASATPRRRSLLYKMVFSVAACAIPFVVCANSGCFSNRPSDARPADVSRRIVMDTNMNQFDPNPSRFESPAFQRECGFNAVALRMNGLPLAVTALYDGYDSRVFPEGSDARKWVLAVREKFAAKIREAKAAGLAVFVNTDVIVLPRRMKELYKDEICRPDGRIDFMKPKTLEIHRALIGEFFDTFPELDGIVVRTGENYTFKTPFHGGNRPCDYWNDLEGSKAAHAALMNLLREEVCVKRGKTCIYRTWDFGYFHVRPDYYRDVAGRVRPHEKFIISIKHCASDFFRGIDFNRTLGLGEHPQIVEVQCQREYEGKGAFPSYIADSVINGFEENEGSPDPHTLRDFAKSPLFAGVWTWSRGGGWVGPCIRNEFWCELNARVMANWANGEHETEEGCFRKAAEAMGVMPESVDALHHLALLTPKAILRGKSASDAAAAKDLPVIWVRDCYLAGINMIIGADWLYNRILDGSIEGILADRRESVGMWEEILELAKTVRCRDKADESYLLTSSLYGLRLFRMIEAGWDVMATGLRGDMFGHVYDTARLKAAIDRYDSAKAEYMNLPRERSDAATLFTDEYVRIKVREAFHEVTPVPGLGESVDRYRKLLPSPKGSALEHTAIDVADPVAVAKWWVENLGFEITSQRDDVTHTTFIVDKTGKIALELYRAKDAPSAPDYHSMRPLALHFGFVSDDVEADIARLTAAGATLVVHEKAPGFDGAMMKDPSGISIQFVKRARPVLREQPR
ncbi:MAG: VOC family protein [Kiritimatiellae bacterium]|nr:VOC family protein [Kiritimatiellia bacterium]